MQKKIISNHPWSFKGKKTQRKKDYYIDAYILDDQMLFIDFYDIKAGIYEPHIRIALADTAFTTLLNDGSFSSAGIEYLLGLEQYGLYSGTARKIFKRIYIHEYEQDLIRDWLKDRRQYVSCNLYFAINDYMREIRATKRESAEERRYRRNQEKGADIPSIPGDFESFLKRKVYRDKHILYFGQDKAFCSRCGREFEAQKKYKHNDIGSCPKCRQRVVFKNQNRVAEHEDLCEVLIIQEHKEQIVFRYFKTMLIQAPGAKERIKYDESVRTYHDEYLSYKNKLIQYYDGMIGCSYWSDKNSYYNQVKYGRNTILYTGNIELIRTILCEQWVMMLEYWADNAVKMPIIDFIQMGEFRAKITEKLFKAGLYKLTKSYVKGSVYGLKGEERELKKVLGVSKPLMHWMQEEDVSLKQYETLRNAYDGDYGLTDSEIIELAAAGIDMNILKNVVVNRKFIKTFHYIKNAKGYNSIAERLNHYRDYLNMAAAMSYDLNNDTVRYPKDIKAAHDKATTEFNQHEADKRKRDAMKKYGNIKTICEKLSDIYSFSDSIYEIIPPRDAGDIIEEGRTLHHCVGGDHYLQNHNDRVSFILFMRKVEDPEQRYYTIEIDPKKNAIKQYYGAYDKKPDKEQVDKFLNKWLKNIKEEKDGINAISELSAV